ncbi:shikimate dehydrogenase family protein [Thermaurantiacus sp.]
MSGLPVAGVMGWPVAQSKSPHIHRFWLQALGRDGDYVRLPVRPEALGAALRGLPALGFAGVNLTLPHKVAALAHVDAADDRARAVGAANLVRVEDGGLVASNSDVEGVREALALLEVGSGSTVAVLGSGGAARAALAALAELGVGEVRLVARNGEAARALLEAFALPGRVWALADAGTAFAGAVVVNATSLGMAGAAPMPAPLVDAVGAAAGVFDMVYAPLETALLARGRGKGLPVVDGLVMLIGQARAGFRAFFAAEPPRERDAELRALLTKDAP